MYCVVVASKMREQVEQLICIKSCIKLEHSSVETIWVIQKATAMGNWRLADSSLPWAFLLMHRVSCSFFCETLNHPGDSASYSPDVTPCDFWLFPKLKSPLKGKRFQTISESQESMTGQLMMIGRTVRSQSAYFEGD